MSVEADFGRSDYVFQASGTQLTWTIAWPGVLDDHRFAAVSFQSPGVRPQLVRISESFSSGDNLSNYQINEVIRANALLGDPGVVFSFAVVVIPNH